MPGNISGASSVIPGVRPPASGPVPTGTERLELPAGFDEVYRSQRTALLRLAYLLVRSQAVAEELTQDAFARLYQHFDQVENPPGFVRTTLVRLCLTWQSRHEMERDRLTRVGEPAPLGEPHIDQMWDALARVRPERRAVLVLRYYDDLPIRAIAALVGCPEPTVRTRLHRGLADLRKELEP